MITQDEYELRLSELSSTINGRFAAVINKQAQRIVGNVYQSTQYKLQPPISTNFNRRLQGTISEIEKTINYPALVVEVVPTVAYVDGKVTIRAKSTAYLYKSRGNKIDVGSDSSFFSGKAVSEYPSLRKFLSQTTAGAVSDTFSTYLKNANLSLKGTGSVLEKLAVYIVDDIQIQRDESILVSTQATRPNTTPPPNRPSMVSTDTPSLSQPQLRPDTNNQPINNESTSNDTTRSSFLDVESVDQLLVRDESTSRFFDVRFTQDDTTQLLTRDGQPISTEDRDTASVAQATNVTENTEEPITIEKNQQLQREYEHQLQVTEAQRLAEFSDALTKEHPKQKSSISPVGTNIAVQLEGGKESAKESATEASLPAKKEEQKAKAKYFMDWAKTEGKDETGIIYRGTKPKDYDKNTTPKNTYGMVLRYKNLFDWGRDLDSMFSGYRINSPIDVALLLNSGAIGRFNKNIPYMFDEGCETHLAITQASNVIRKDEGGVGDFSITSRDYLDANWAANPHWCGLFTNFVLFTNGRYKSDSNLVNIIATGKIAELYTESPFNTIPKHLSKKEKERLQARLDELNADTTGASILEKKKIEDKLNSTRVTINEQNSCVLLKYGIHWSNNGMTPDGVEILNKILHWPGAFIVRRANGKNSGHVETLLHITKTGVIYTIGGNTGLKDSNGNGSEYGFKKYNSIREFCGNGYDLFYIYKRGSLAPYTNGIGVSVKKTETYDKYVKDLEVDSELSTATYNILREIMED